MPLSSRTSACRCRVRVRLVGAGPRRLVDATTDTLDELWSAHLEAIGAFLAVSRFAALARGAALIAFSEGPERGDLIAMGDAVARLARIAWRIVWLTPLAADPAFEPRTADLVAARPYLDELGEARSTASAPRFSI